MTLIILSKSSYRSVLPAWQCTVHNQEHAHPTQRLCAYVEKEEHIPQELVNADGPGFLLVHELFPFDLMEDLLPDRAVEVGHQIPRHVEICLHRHEAFLAFRHGPSYGRRAFLCHGRNLCPCLVGRPSPFLKSIDLLCLPYL